MSMEISNSYGNYYVGMNAGTQKNSAAAKSSNDNVQEYYVKLCKKFPQISFNTGGGEMRCSSNKVVVNLSQECLKKMANDPEFAKKIEWNLSGEVTANNLVYSNAKRDGVELGGRTVTYDADGNRQSSCGGMRTANAGNSNNKVNNKSNDQNERIRKRREERKAFEEKLAKKRAEKKAEEERLAKRRAEKAEAEECISGDNLTVTDNSMADLTQSIVSSNPVGMSNVSGWFDVKA